MANQCRGHIDHTTVLHIRASNPTDKRLGKMPSEPNEALPMVIKNSRAPLLSSLSLQPDIGGRSIEQSRSISTYVPVPCRPTRHLDLEFHYMVVAVLSLLSQAS
jgi:hypothetical protein